MWIVLLALAMGLQSATGRNLGVPGLTTAMLTTTLTALAADSTLAGGKNPDLGRHCWPRPPCYWALPGARISSFRSVSVLSWLLQWAYLPGSQSQPIDCHHYRTLGPRRPDRTFFEPGGLENLSRLQGASLNERLRTDSDPLGGFGCPPRFAASFMQQCCVATTMHFSCNAEQQIRNEVETLREPNSHRRQRYIEMVGGVVLCGNGRRRHGLCCHSRQDWHD
jgi:hypothetical protein